VCFFFFFVYFCYGSSPVSPGSQIRSYRRPADLPNIPQELHEILIGLLLGSLRIVKGRVNAHFGSTTELATQLMLFSFVGRR